MIAEPASTVTDNSSVHPLHADGLHMFAQINANPDVNTNNPARGPIACGQQGHK
jgi:hypothetical protein